MHVIALIGDLVHSKELEKRGAFQRRLVKVLEQTGSTATQLASPYTVTLGDEFQAVYRAADSLFADMLSIMAEIHPVQTRFALGLGELTTRINSKQALGMDGPAFHRARAALNELKSDAGLLRIRGEDEARWKLANRALNLISHHAEGWSRNRLLIVAGLLRGTSVREIEDGLRISRVAVYKNIRAAALDDVVGICHELTREMNDTLRSS